ncbi:MAG: hypothetical protein V1780_00290 [Chloroflexota bacterium]
MQVTIASDRRSEACPAHCGVDWSDPEAIARARQHLRDRFGDGVTLTGLDLATTEPPQELEAPLRAGNLPRLLINGQPRISGPFDLRMLADTIKTEMEMARNAR